MTNTQSAAPGAAEVEAQIASLMTQMQVVASAWSLVGGRFDFGQGMEDFEIQKSDFEDALRAAIQKSSATVEPNGLLAHAMKLALRMPGVDGADLQHTIRQLAIQVPPRGQAAYVCKCGVCSNCNPTADSNIHIASTEGSTRFRQALNSFGFDGALEQTLKERDHYHEVADDLAYRIEAITKSDIGEHSSSNNPWQNAKDAADELLASRTPAPWMAGGVGAEPYGKGPARPASQWGPTDIQRWPDAYAEAKRAEATSAGGAPLVEKSHVCGVSCHKGDANCNGYCTGKRDAPAMYFTYAAPQPAPAVQVAKPLTEKQIEEGWLKTFSTNNPFCPCDLKTFTKAARWAEAVVGAGRARS